MKPIIVGILSVFVVIISVGATFVVVNAYKNQEILDIKTQYEVDIDDLTGQLNNYQFYYEKEKAKFIGNWSIFNTSYDYDNIIFLSDGTFKIIDTNGTVYLNETWDVGEGGLLTIPIYSTFFEGELLQSFILYYYCFYNNDTTLLLKEYPNQAEQFIKKINIDFSGIYKKDRSWSDTIIHIDI